MDAALDRHRVAIRSAREARGHAVARAERLRALSNLERFAGHANQLHQLLRSDVDVLISESGANVGRVEARRTIIQDRVAKIEEHRAIVLKALDDLADEGIRLLERAERRSILPDGLQAWTGLPFLQVHLGVPRSQEQRLGLLGELLNEIVHEQEAPEGLALAHRAIVKLAIQGITATILKPDPFFRRERASIVELASFSGAQRLTAAILIYCTLANLRATSRGHAPKDADAGVLILDNPIGTCSSIQLLDMQRTVSRLLRVQLVYTTHVKDLDALATLPNVVRLATDHRDVRTGDLHITLDPDESRVNGIRVARVAPEPP